MTLNIKRSKVPHVCSISNPESKISFSMANRYWVTGQFEPSAPNDPKWPFKNTKRPKLPHIHVMLLLPPSSKSRSVSLYGQPLFELQAIFETNVLNDPKMTLNTRRSKLPHIHVTTITQFQISLRFALWPSVFGLQDILGQMHWMTPKWPWTLRGQRYSICMWQLPPTPKFHTASLYTQPFSSYRPIWDKYTE